MKFPSFEYLRATSLEEAVWMLANDEDAKVLAGGQSLLPLLALRLARPSVLVDITALALDYVSIEHEAGELHLGGLVRQRRVELDPEIQLACPLLADALRQVGYPATRNLGTVCGSLAHADPSAELPTVAVALGARVRAVGPRGEREIACADLADGYFTTTLEPGEVLIEITLPVASAGHGAAFCEWAPRRHDFAEVGVAVAVDLDDGGRCVHVGAAACGIGAVPLDLSRTLVSAGLLEAPRHSPALCDAVAALVEEAVMSAGEDRAQLTGLLAGRATRLAFERASERLSLRPR